MTDGQPDCGFDGSGPAVPGALDSGATSGVIGDAAVQGIPTFVVGIGALDASTGDALSMMALAGGPPRGGSPAYYPVADAIDVFNTMNRVVATIGACTFAVPAPPGNDGTTSREDISVSADGMSVPQDSNNGWTYVDASHTSLTFHGSSCDAVLAGTIQHVFIVFNCYI